MKKFIKENYIEIILMTISVLAILFGILESYNTYLEDLSVCNEALELKLIDECLVTKRSAFYVYIDILIFTEYYLIFLFAPFIILICSIRKFHKKIYSGYIQNELSRINYKKYMKKSVFQIWKRSLILFLMLFTFLILTYIYTGNFNDPNVIETAYIGSGFFNVTKFIFLYYSLIIIYGMIISNIGLLFCKIKRPFPVIVTFTYIAYILIEFIIVILNDIFYLFKIDLYLFNLTEFLNLDKVGLNKVLFSLIYLIISIILVFVVYRKKEVLLYENSD